MSALKSISAHEPVSEAKPVERQPSAAEVARAVRRLRARKLLRSVLLWVLVPTLLSCFYFFGVARDQYQSVATLYVHDAHGVGVMLREYLQSRDMLTKLEQRARFSQHYADQGEPLFGLSRDAGSETRYGAFRHVVSVRLDTGSGVLTLTVRAYSPSAAHDFAQVLIDEGESFVERVGARGLAREPVVDARGPAREPVVDARGSAREPSVDAHGSADEPVVDAQSAAKLTEIARPSLPNESNYPHRGYGVLTAFLVSLSLYVIGSLLIMAVREHAQF